MHATEEKPEMAESIREENYKALLEQRKMLFEDIMTMTRTFHTSIFSALTVLSAFFGFVVKELPAMDPSYADFTVFAIILIVLGLAFFITLVLFNMNNDRDYIRAIDRHLQEEYRITEYFYQGEISYRHINQYNSHFSRFTLMGGLFAFVLVLALLILLLDKIILLFTQYFWYSLVISLMLVVLGFLIGKNFYVYKYKGISHYYDDCYAFLKNGTLPEGKTRKSNGRKKDSANNQAGIAE